MASSHEAVLARMENLYRMLFAHSGYGEMSIEIRYLRKHEKEVIIKCGKQYRFVVPCGCGSCAGDGGDACACRAPDEVGGDANNT